MDDRPAPTVPALKDFTADDFGFWGVVSGTWTVEEWEGRTKDSHLFPSELRQQLKLVLASLASAGAIDPRTVNPPFDANRRCRDCGAIHEESPVLRRSGEKCFRTMWGGPVKLNAAGLNRRTR